VTFAALLIAALSAPLARAQTLRDVLTEHRVPVAPGGPSRLDARITSYAVEDAPDLFAIAYYILNDHRGVRTDTIRVSVWDRARRAWTHAGLERWRHEPPEWEVGSIIAIQHTDRFVVLTTHESPSAGTTIVLTRALTPVVALRGWLLTTLPGNVMLYHHSMMHFAPTHSAELWTWDPSSGRDALLYPTRPWDSVRQAYVDSTRVTYARVGEDWFRIHNHHMDPEQFDASLVDSVVADAEGRRVAFQMRFGGGDGTPAATPRLDVVVSCQDPGYARARCSETPLSALQRRYPGWPTDRILDDLVNHPQNGRPPP